MRVAIYARVSTAEQRHDLQLDDLREYTARMGHEVVEYLEKESSVKTRPVLNQMMQDARMRKFDEVIVWKIDRFARSMKQFIDLTLELQGHGVVLRSLTQNLCSDARDPMGNFVLKLFALLAELERGIIVERVRAGMKAAKHRGKHCGRPKKIFDRDQALMLKMEGLSTREIAKKLKVGKGTVQRLLALP